MESIQEAVGNQSIIRLWQSAEGRPFRLVGTAGQIVFPGIFVFLPTKRDNS
jgi:hypothetical protein